ncbi:Annexin-like protein RJ4 [Hibiscus syriacus]|uniref:Annexin n=1 Tax=Hibiscus syriacus TaxID=106335 RepID=A0A6A3AC86_HIBSY|nr:Annexin-like protein RJ4 [Hibiscus syriacus]
MATIAVPNQVSISDDAQALYKACKGWGTDEKAIIAVLGRRNAAQRRQIRQAYEELYDEDLVRRLERELSGDFEKAMYRWILDPADRDAVLAHAELRKSSHEHPVLVEISYEGEEINKKLAKSEAKELHEAIKDNKFNNDDVIRIITSRSKPQLQATFNFYREEEGTSITKNLPNKSKDEFLETLRITVRCFKDPVKYFEKVLRKSIQRLGTDEDALTRVIVTRAEKDLKEIKELYCRRNSVRLDDAVDKDTRGDYKDMLLTLLGNEV